MATFDVLSYLPKQWVDAPQRGGEFDRHADFLPLPSLETMQRQLDYRLNLEFGERRPTDRVLSEAQIQRCAGLFAQLDQNAGRENKVKEAEKLLYASGYISLALTAYYSATIFFTSDTRQSIVESNDPPAAVLIPAALFISGFILLGRATSTEYTLRERMWHECLGKKEAYGREGGALGQLRFEGLPVDLPEAALTCVATADAIAAPIFHRTKPRPEFSIRIPLPTVHPSNAIVLTGAVALAAIGAAIGVAIMLSPFGI